MYLCEMEVSSYTLTKTTFHNGLNEDVTLKRSAKLQKNGILPANIFCFKMKLFFHLK